MKRPGCLDTESGGRFQKGQSGNPNGRPKLSRSTQTSAFDIVVEKKLTVTRHGAPREVTIQEALQHRTYQDAIAGKRMAQRDILKWIGKRELWFAKNAPERAQRFIFCGQERDPDNADATLVLLGIVRQNPYHAAIAAGVAAGFCDEQAPLLLEPWAVEAALRRRRSTKALTDSELAEIRRCTRDPRTINALEA